MMQTAEMVLTELINNFRLKMHVGEIQRRKESVYRKAVSTIAADMKSSVRPCMLQQMLSFPESFLEFLRWPFDRIPSTAKRDLYTGI